MRFLFLQAARGNNIRRCILGFGPSCPNIGHHPLIRRISQGFCSAQSMSRSNGSVMGLAGWPHVCGTCPAARGIDQARVMKISRKDSAGSVFVTESDRIKPIT
jgi:hypothetical protein